MLHSSPTKGRRPGDYRKLFPASIPKVLKIPPYLVVRGLPDRPQEILSTLAVSPPVGECCPLVWVPLSATTACDLFLSQ